MPINLFAAFLKFNFQSFNCRKVNKLGDKQIMCYGIGAWTEILKIFE